MSKPPEVYKLTPVPRKWRSSAPMEQDQYQNQIGTSYSTWIRNDIPSIYCACSNCKKYYETRPITNLPEQAPEFRPRFGYIHLVSSMREAAARREQENNAKEEMAQEAVRREAEKSRLLASRDRDAIMQDAEDPQAKRRKL
ncbi:uncharacterized protein LOC118267461 isoform X2 [Spodoptera frugiperda]|nr:uncharacterized protein LOC118267461 isoform X2 [Spodoptera frugiperda]